MWQDTFRALYLDRVKRTKKVPSFTGLTWLYPRGTERSYSAYLRNAIKDIYRPGKKIVRENYSRWLREAHPKVDSQTLATLMHGNTHNDALHTDAGEDIPSMQEAMLDRQKVVLEEMAKSGVQSGGTLAGIIGFGEKVQKFNQKEMDRYIKQAIGQAFQPDEPWLSPALQGWRDVNHSLISTLSTNSISRMNTLVTEAVTYGRTYKDLTQDILKLERQSLNHAKLIARDQIGKLNGTVTQRRQQEAGLDKYRWLTARDERVRGKPGGRYPHARPSHWVMDDLICVWNDSTVYVDKDGNLVARPSNAPQEMPGIAIQCRCVAIPYMDDLIAEGEALLAGNGIPEPEIETPAEMPVPATPKPKKKVTPKASPKLSTKSELESFLSSDPRIQPHSPDLIVQELLNFQEDTGIDAKKYLSSLDVSPKASRVRIGLDKYKDEYVFTSTAEDILGVQLSEIERRFNKFDGRKTWVVDHELFTLDKSIQGKGIAKKTLKDQFQMYADSGINQVQLGASLDRGGYTWARFGFVPNPNSWKVLVKEFDTWAKSGQDVTFGTALDKFIDRLDPSKPEHIWKIADSKWGKQFLSGRSWFGSFDMKDKRAITRFNGYTKSKLEVRK